MKILLTGNMGSGKSHLARKVLKAMSTLPYHPVDAYRRRYGDGSLEQDAVARAAFLVEIQASGPMLIECMGLGDLGLEVQEVLQGAPLTVIRLAVSLDLCLRRLTARTWDLPYPGTPETARSLCIQSQEAYEAGEIEKRFAPHAAGGVHVFPHTLPLHTARISAFIQEKMNHETA